jgi:hypothetical protein
MMSLATRAGSGQEVYTNGRTTTAMWKMGCSPVLWRPNMTGLASTSLRFQEDPASAYMPVARLTQPRPAAKLVVVYESRQLQCSKSIKHTLWTDLPTFMLAGRLKRPRLKADICSPEPAVGRKKSHRKRDREGPVTESAESNRLRMLEIRNEFRRLLATSPPLRNKAIFYSGMSSSLPRFISYLAAKNPAFAGAANLENLPAGLYLQSVKSELVRMFGTKDFEVRRTFQLTNGSEFTASINGFWRELSARYANACSGVAHVLVSHDRTEVHFRSLEFWANRNVGIGGAPPGLRVFGFVEFPILIGALSSNSGISAINIYVEPTPGQFRLLQSPFLISRSGQA